MPLGIATSQSPNEFGLDLGLARCCLTTNSDFDYGER